MAMIQLQGSPSSVSSSSSSFRQGSIRSLQTKINVPISQNHYFSLNFSTFSNRSYSVCKASWQELAGVLIFSAIPFTAVKAIANSPLGESLQRRLEENKKDAVANSAKFKALVKNARKDSLWYGEERPRWLGPIPYDYPAYLTGELPGDYGFDIAGLSKDPVAFQKYFNFEILHARWAMLASLGALVPEVLDLLGAFHFIEPVWWRVGYSKLKASIVCLSNYLPLLSSMDTMVNAFPIMICIRQPSTIMLLEFYQLLLFLYPPNLYPNFLKI